MVERVEGDSVAARLIDGQAWRFTLEELETMTEHHEWTGEIAWE